MTLDFDGPTDALPLVGAVTSAVAVLPPWIVVAAGPVEPTALCYETAHGLLTAAAAAVVLVAALADRVEERAAVALPGGFVVALLAVAQWVMLGDVRQPRSASTSRWSAVPSRPSAAPRPVRRSGPRTRRPRAGPRGRFRLRV